MPSYSLGAEAQARPGCERGPTKCMERLPETVPGWEPLLTAGRTISRDGLFRLIAMRRLLFLVAMLLVPLAASVPVCASATARQPILATLDTASTSRLFYVDPVSLRPIGARSLGLDFHWGDFTRSPEGALLVLSSNDAPELRFVRLPGMRFVGSMTFTDGQFVRLVAWPSPHLLLALLDSSPERVLAIDPSTRKVLWRRSVDGTVVDIQAAPGRVVVLAAPANKIGPARIVVIGTGGSVRSVVLERVLAGFHHKQGSQDFIAKNRTPGLAIDPAGERAYVVGADEPVAQIGLASMRVRYHGGLRVPAKAVSGPLRQATWLGNGMLAVSGTDSSISTDAQGNVKQDTAPAGLLLINTHSWTSRSLQPNAEATITAGSSLLAYRSGYDSATKTRAGSGLTIYSLDGTPRVHLLAHTSIDWVQSQGGLAYVWLTNPNGLADHVVVIDPGSGRILARETRSITLLTRS